MGEYLKNKGEITVVKAVYYTVVVHNFNLQEKTTTSTIEVTTNFVKEFKAHFEKKLLYYAGITSFVISKYFMERVMICVCRLLYNDIDL